MSTQKTANWTDGFVSNSDLPADEFTWTDGSNYGLDGFHHLQTMNEGVMNHGDQSGMAGPITPAQMASAGDIPDDFFSNSAPDDEDDTIHMSDEVDGLNLSAMLSEDEGALHLSQESRQAASLADLAWLDPDQEQDPSRLPKELLPDRPPLNSVPELEEAWGVERRTDGLSLVPNRDKAIMDYERSIDSPLPETPGNAGVPMHLALTRAIRRSTYGDPLRAIKAELVLNLGEDRAAMIMERVAVDHGLNGTVFIRASAFPGIKSGKWAKHLRKVARTARYVITDDHAVATKLGLKMVSEVPWKKALAHYRPRLKAAGYKLASGHNPEAILRRAFLSGPAKAKVKASFKPTVVAPADTVTASAAKAALMGAPKQARVVLTTDETAKARKKVTAKLLKAVKAGFITRADALRLGQSKASPHAISRTAALLARANQMPKQAVYGGVGTEVTIHRQAGHDAAWASLKQAELASAAMKKAERRIVKMVNAGQLTKREARHALQQASPKAILKVAAAIVQAAGTERKAVMKATATHDFEGPLLTRALQQQRAGKKHAGPDAAMHKMAKASGIKVAEFKRLSTWFRRQMSEGLAGRDLTDMLRVRYASPLRTAAASLISGMRTEHEGLSGHLYVDAAAYASTKGTKGCEKAASKHRATQVPTVLAMSRCKGCVFANTNNVCTKYGKELLHSLPSDARAYQRDMVRLADAPDHEITASLFNPSEFDLTSSMEHIALDSEAPSNEEIGDVLFGGMHF